MSRELSKPQAISYLKRQIPNWDDNKIRLSYKIKYSDSEIYLVVNNEIITVKTWYTEYDLDSLVSKLKEYFDTGIWDTNVYYEVYGDNAITPLVSISVTEAEDDDEETDDDEDYMEKLRNKYGDLGFRKVDKYKNPTLTVDQYLAYTP